MSRETGIVKSEPQPMAQSAERPAVAPPCDIYENADEILVVADVPGAVPETIEINLDKNELSITARRELPAVEGSLLAAEHRDRDFRRRFAVPGGIDANRITADLRDGVLTLHLPKSEALKPRQIAVRAG
ncbi:MAG: Hsp20/alpha crystallin family protein [Myxococcales bacterium]|nr:Hsp20/alpha crystallin family protein [Myxococcota bacterium]MDW8282225.1 Hsp20/alpha crystallin family protein [Myxococcales bacterium]